MTMLLQLSSSTCIVLFYVLSGQWVVSTKLMNDTLLYNLEERFSLRFSLSIFAIDIYT